MDEVPAIKVPRNTLALDLATTTGWCWREPRGGTAGIWQFKASRRDSDGMLLIRLENKLNEVNAYQDAVPILHHEIELVVFENVTFAKTTYAAQLWGGLYRGMTAWCERRGIPFAGVTVGTLKKWATGNGNCGKPAMLAACQRRLGVTTTSHDEADARLLLAYAQEVGV